LLLPISFSSGQLDKIRCSQLKEKIERLRQEIKLIKDERTGYTKRLQDVFVGARKEKIELAKKELRRRRSNRMKLRSKNIFK
jgi:hypothetical protein